jgi:hypothetical protein
MMQTVETTILKEARRCRLAQFCGRSRTLEVAGATFTGIVRSVREVKSAEQRSWIVTFVPPQPTRRDVAQPIRA